MIGFAIDYNSIHMWTSVGNNFVSEGIQLNILIFCWYLVNPPVEKMQTSFNNSLTVKFQKDMQALIKDMMGSSDQGNLQSLTSKRKEQQIAIQKFLKESFWLLESETKDHPFLDPNDSDEIEVERFTVNEGD